MKPQISFAPEGVGSAGGDASPGSASAPSGASSSASSSTPSGASPTPSPSPSSTEGRPSPSSASSPVAEKGVDFGEDFFAPLSEIEVSDDPVSVEAQAPEPKEPISKPQEPSKEPAPPPQQPVEPQKPTTEPQAPEARADEDSASIPLHEPGRLADAMRQNQGQLIPALAERYTLSPEEVEALETDAASAVPQLLAKVHFNATVSAVQNLQLMIPAMLQQHLSVYQSAQENLDKFFGAWPQLDRVKHRQEVLSVAKQYRAINPKAVQDQMIRDVGQLVALRVGVPLQPGSPPSGPMSAAGGRAPPPSPFVPASNGVGAPPSKAEEHPFGGLYEQE